MPTPPETKADVCFVSSGQKLFGPTKCISCAPSYDSRTRMRPSRNMYLSTCCVGAFVVDVDVCTCMCVCVYVCMCVCVCVRVSVREGGETGGGTFQCVQTQTHMSSSTWQNQLSFASAWRRVWNRPISCSVLQHSAVRPCEDGQPVTCRRPYSVMVVVKKYSQYCQLLGLYHWQHLST